MNCSKCHGPMDRKSARYCKACHAGYMREWRKVHPLSEAQRVKDNARSYAGVYLRRGRLGRSPCQRCGTNSAEMHHPNYTQPLLVEWYCRDCHLSLHRESRLDAMDCQ